MSRSFRPGEVIPGKGDIELNPGRRPVRMVVTNMGDRPVQVGSHFHFFEANRCLDFPRSEAFGKRLNIPAGTSVRFEPGDRREVELIDVAGKKMIRGLNGLADGKSADEALAAAREKGFRGA
jgi:urease subunit gamma/beta